MKFDNDIFVEDKKAVCDAMCEALRKTSAAGNPINNALVELRYIEFDDGREIVRPIFENGCGENGYYDIESVGNLYNDGGEEDYVFRTNNPDIQVTYNGDVKEMYYSGYYYYLPVINGKSK